MIPKLEISWATANDQILLCQKKGSTPSVSFNVPSEGEKGISCCAYDCTNAGKKNQNKTSEHLIVSSILTDLVFRLNSKRRAALLATIIKPAII